MDLLAIQDSIHRGHRIASIHAATEMLADMLDPDDVWACLCQPATEVIEDYPSDPRGSSCLLFGFIAMQPIHCVVAYPAKRHASGRGIIAVAFLITVYCPDQHPQEWSADFRTRLQQI